MILKYGSIVVEERLKVEVVWDNLRRRLRTYELLLLLLMDVAQVCIVAAKNEEMRSVACSKAH